MRSPLDYFRKADHVIEALKASDGAVMARLHVEGFKRPWSDGEFRALLSQGPVFGFIARPQGGVAKPAGFVLSRLVAGEAEILTVVVSKSSRRTGVGHKLVSSVLRHLNHVRAETVFLEVDEANTAAIGLYRSFGFLEVARRTAYYDTQAGKSAALVMRLDLK
jgi:[ribosomal protein S18]-alanine N-acetyltransferase